MDNLIFKPILVSGIESANNKITLLEQETGKQYPVKYSFFQFKQGSEEQTKAYTQFLELGVSKGKVYEIAVKETNGINKNNGQPVIYRNIAYFKTGSKTAPQQPQDSQTVNSPCSTTNPAVSSNFTPQSATVGRQEFITFANQINDALKTLNKKVGGIETWILGQGDNKNGLELHQSTHPKEETSLDYEDKNNTLGEGYENIPSVK